MTQEKGKQHRRQRRGRVGQGWVLQQDKDDDKKVYVSMGILLYSIHIQFFSQNQSLLLLSLIQIQIIITRMTQEEKRQPQYKEISEW